MEREIATESEREKDRETEREGKREREREREGEKETERDTATILYLPQAAAPSPKLREQDGKRSTTLFSIFLPPPPSFSLSLSLLPPSLSLPPLSLSLSLSLPSFAVFLARCGKVCQSVLGPELPPPPGNSPLRNSPPPSSAREPLKGEPLIFFFHGGQRLGSELGLTILFLQFAKVHDEPQMHNRQELGACGFVRVPFL